MRHIQITDKANCCGCTACESVCGHNAISLKPDSHGFNYPVVNIEKCVECGLCEKVCTFLHPNLPKSNDLQQIYGIRLKNESDILKSQSGGAFKAIADRIIKNGYIIYGVTLDNSLEVRHESASTIEEANKFRGSKYVQSNLNGIFQEIIQRLRKKEKVLFVGVGCQVAGLISLCDILKIDKSNLLTVDMICYGVPSPRYWKDYLKWMEKKYGAKIVGANFRDKTAGGWRSSRNSLMLENGRKVFPDERFYQPLLFRRSCNKCPFTNFNRKSDITIGDFWGIEKINPEFGKDNKGVSLMLLNTQKGIECFEQIKFSLRYFETTREECVQPQLIRPNPINPQKNLWESIYEKYGYEKAVKKLNLYRKPTKLRTFLGKVKRNIFH